MSTEDVKKNKVLSSLNRGLNKVEFTQEQLRTVLNLLEPMDLQPFKGAKADGVVKVLANKCYPYCKDSIKMPVLLNILYTIIAGQSCTVSYTVAAAVEEARIMYEDNHRQYPLEFFLSETLECVTSAPDKFKVFAKEDEETEFTLQSAIEGIIGKEIVFPSDTNRIVAYPDTDFYLAYVTGGSRWLAILSVDIAGKVSSYNNPITYSPKGLMQGDTLLRFMNNRNGVVTDDYIIL